MENTIGRLCTEKKAELHIDEAEYFADHRRQMQTKKRLLDQLHQYRDWLLQITILDPACGSGAFLNAALQFLMAEHRLIDEMEAKVAGSSLVFQDVENSILENNLFGVDINEESVEIAQLALWLRTAKPHRKLNTLSENIKCGNSLISDPEIAGEKAFNWQEQFPKVFEKGGFDVVIGNPPYVRVQQLDYETIDFLKSIYKTALKRIDMSLCFIEKSKELIKSNGIVSFITSNQFLTTEYGQAMRKFLLEDYFLTKCVDFGDLKIFEDAMTYVSIFSFTNIPQKSFDYCRVKEIKDAENGQYDNFHKIVLSDLTEDNWNLQNYSMSKIFQRVFENDKTIEDLGNAWYGIVTGADSVFIFDREDYEKTEIEKDLFLPLLRAQSCGKYYCEKAEKYVLYPYKYEDGETVLLSQDEIENKYPNGWKYFLEHKEELESRKDSRSTFEGRDDWYCLTRFGQKKIFNRDKIVTPGEVKGHKFCIDRSQAGYSGARVFGITIDKEDLSLEYVLCNLNSSLIRSYLQSTASLKAGGYYSYSSNVLNKIPIKDISPDAQQPFIALADTMLSLNSQLQEKRSRFLRRLTENMDGVKITTALQTFDQMDFADFVVELKKQKIKLSLVQQDEWENYFNQYAQVCKQLTEEIQTTDQEIDNRVFDLYGLTPDERQIVIGKE